MRDVLHRKANFSEQAKLRFWELPAAPTTCWKGLCSASASGLHINRERLWLFESHQWLLRPIVGYKTNRAVKLDVECRSQSSLVFSDLFSVYRQLANFSREGVGLGMTNVCQSRGDPFCVLPAFWRPPLLWQDPVILHLLSEMGPTQTEKNLCLLHYRITHLTEDSVKVDALTSEAKSITNWLCNWWLIVTAVFSCNTI